MIETIQARRDALAAEIEVAKAEYAQIEQVLTDLRRAIDMQMGGLKELDDLLATLAAQDAYMEAAPAS